jgi:hypothetical protein
MAPGGSIADIIRRKWRPIRVQRAITGNKKTDAPASHRHSLRPWCQYSVASRKGYP